MSRPVIRNAYRSGDPKVAQFAARLSRARRQAAQDRETEASRLAWSLGVSEGALQFMDTREGTTSSFVTSVGIDFDVPRIPASAPLRFLRAGSVGDPEQGTVRRVNLYTPRTRHRDGPALRQKMRELGYSLDGASVGIPLDIIPGPHGAGAWVFGHYDLHDLGAQGVFLTLGFIPAQGAPRPRGTFRQVDPAVFHMARGKHLAQS